MFFDLSRVGWVELNALVQLTLLVESALANAIKVKLAWPLPHARHSESKYLKNHTTPSAGIASVKRRIAKRAALCRYLDYIKFEFGFASRAYPRRCTSA